MNSGMMTKMPNTSMFGMRKKAIMPPFPVSRCQTLSGASIAAASQRTGAAKAAPIVV